MEEYSAPWRGGLFYKSDSRRWLWLIILISYGGSTFCGRPGQRGGLFYKSNSRRRLWLIVLIPAVDQLSVTAVCKYHVLLVLLGIQTPFFWAYNTRNAQLGFSIHTAVTSLAMSLAHILKEREREGERERESKGAREMDCAATGMWKVKIDIEEVRQAASSLFENLRKDQKEAAWNLFQAVDVDKNGYLSFEEFKTFLTNFGFETENCYWLFAELDKDKDGFLDFMELVTFFNVLLQRDEYKHQLSMASTVRAVETPAATSMWKVKIDIEEVRQAASSLFKNLRKDQKEAAWNLFQAIDVDKNGYLSFEEFKTFLTNFGFETENCYWLFAELDKDKDGFLDFMELVTFFNVLLQRDEYKHQLSMASTARAVETPAAIGMWKVKIDIEEVRQAASSLFENLRKDQKEAAWNLFQAVDVDKNGYLSFEEFETFLTNFGFETENCYWLFAELDKDKDGFLDFMELVTFFYVLLQRDEYKHKVIMASTVRAVQTPAATSMWKVKIDIEEVRQAASSLFENLRKDQKEAAWNIFQAMDVDKNGYLSFEEFETFLTNFGFETENCYWLFAELDKDKDGFLDFMELVTFFYVFLQRDEYKHQLSMASTVGTSQEVENSRPTIGANDLVENGRPTTGANDLVENGRPTAGANDQGRRFKWQESIHMLASEIQIGQLGFQIGQFLVQTGCTIV